MENLPSTIVVPEPSYFDGWFIALRNYEKYEIEKVKEVVSDPINENGQEKYSKRNPGR